MIFFIYVKFCSPWNTNFTHQFACKNCLHLIRHLQNEKTSCCSRFIRHWRWHQTSHSLHRTMNTDSGLHRLYILSGLNGLKKGNLNSWLMYMDSCWLHWHGRKVIVIYKGADSWASCVYAISHHYGPQGSNVLHAKPSI